MAGASLSPAAEIVAAATWAHEGVDRLDEAGLLARLCLDGDTPDGKSLTTRLMAGEPELTQPIAAAVLANRMVDLIHATNRGEANPARITGTLLRHCRYEARYQRGRDVLWRTGTSPNFNAYRSDCTRYQITFGRRSSRSVTKTVISTRS